MMSMAEHRQKKVFAVQGRTRSAGTSAVQGLNLGVSFFICLG